MKFNSVFDRVAKQAELLPEEMQPAKAWFNLGVAAAQGEAKQKPVLERKLPSYGTIYDSKLTQAEVMSLRSSIAYTISMLHGDIHLLQSFASALYNVCDKEKPETTSHFEELNKARSTLRDMKQKMKTLVAIQKKLKKYA